MTTRLFFGLELPDSWKAHLADLQHVFRTRHIDVGAWSNPALLHITVLFLGVLGDEHRAFLHQVASEAARETKPIRLTTGSFGAFSRNKIFWLGLDRNKTDWQTLNALHERVRDGLLGQIPFHFDDKRYRPHITLARKLSPRFDVDRLPEPEPLETVVTELCLFESIRIDGELQYPVRARFSLSGVHE